MVGRRARWRRLRATRAASHSLTPIRAPADGRILFAGWSGITAERVLPESELPDDRGVRESYAAARAHPAIFDGLFCVCRCQRSHGHRSLLACFESDQPAGCYGCREQAELVAKLARAGKRLAEIRAAVDEKYG